ncbi:DUF2079 domain-containing protein [Calothrix sp. UHCC 0171]|uniref:DUF2079 domain-containing protein n=1 Tax=Calothrix sp. UHCC 0171 TaxID=3110245 RepID=UPI002B1FDB0E|nr:DUF2079 domain-containing protein [Calothrix sp. UHCC 0171]MEA5572221.1 DUF2079 domain-containing protein [Calothrix sp. UHCC 0171]
MTGKRELSNLNNIVTPRLAGMIGISAVILFICSSLRHLLFQSHAFDLGIFDQAVYLISQELTPISTFMGYHILGDHAAYIWYPLALLYKIYPSIYWLFAVQALALSLGALPTWHLARQAGLTEKQAVTMALVYLLYPVVFNVNLFDFHPEVIALPTLLAAIWCARGKRFWWFCWSIIVILGCKAVLSLTVAAMGLWLLVFEKRRWCGILALILGISWFAIASGVIIPTFSGKEAAAVGRYSYLGDSVFDIAKGLLLKPGLILANLFNFSNLIYLLLLMLPIAWGISYSSTTPLIAAIPCIGLNLITDYQPQKDLVHQYSLPALPFLLLVVITTLAAGKGWIRSPKFIILWSLLTFLFLAKFTYFGSIYLKKLDAWQATHTAISLVKTKGSVLTTGAISSHLSHRQLIKLADSEQPLDELTQFDYILLDTRYPGFGNTPESASKMVNFLRSHADFNLEHEGNGIYLFHRK